MKSPRKFILQPVSVRRTASANETATRRTRHRKDGRPKPSPREKKLSPELGVLGRVVGSAANIPIYVGGYVVCILVTAGIVTHFTGGPVAASEFFKGATPIITLALGFMFGRTSTKPPTAE